MIEPEVTVSKWLKTGLCLDDPWGKTVYLGTRAVDALRDHFQAELEDLEPDHKFVHEVAQSGSIEMGEEEMNNQVKVVESHIYGGGLYVRGEDVAHYHIRVGEVEDLRKHFLAERDELLGRVKHEETGLYVYPIDGCPNQVQVIKEEYPVVCSTEYRGAAATPINNFERAAAWWFAAHPPARELPTALGAIVEGTGRKFIRTVAGDVSVMPWTEVKGGGWYDDHDLLEVVGPDWKLVHEGMTDD